MQKRFNLLRLLPMLIILVGIIIFLIYNDHLNNKFVRDSVNSVVVKKSNWQLRATEFYLKNGLRVDSSYIIPLDIKIGDSLSKKNNTGKFNIYRKTNGKYVFYRSYDIVK